VHVPYTVANEKNDGIKNWLGFAHEKVREVSLLSKMFRDEPVTETENNLINANLKIIEEKKVSLKVNNPSFQQRIKNISKFERVDAYSTRMSIQKKAFKFPALPTTTIGSFPQTEEIRKIRSDYKNNIISLGEYEDGIRKYIDGCVAFQEEIGLDVLVHGEPERNDMVEYFGEMLLGFHFTANGWVQKLWQQVCKTTGDLWRRKQARPHDNTMDNVRAKQNKKDNERYADRARHYFELVFCQGGYCPVGGFQANRLGAQ